jgi:hypothetical protein
MRRNASVLFAGEPHMYASLLAARLMGGRMRVQVADHLSVVARPGGLRPHRPTARRPYAGRAVIEGRRAPLDGGCMGRVDTRVGASRSWHSAGGC